MSRITGSDRVLQNSLAENAEAEKLDGSSDYDKVRSVSSPVELHMAA